MIALEHEARVVHCVVLAVLFPGRAMALLAPGWHGKRWKCNKGEHFSQPPQHMGFGGGYCDHAWGYSCRLLWYFGDMRHNNWCFRRPPGMRFYNFNMANSGAWPWLNQIVPRYDMMWLKALGLKAFISCKALSKAWKVGFRWAECQLLLNWKPLIWFCGKNMRKHALTHETSLNQY